MADDPIYLSVEQVLELHEDAIESFGGTAGVRDVGLLESAVIAPRQSAFGEDALSDHRGESGSLRVFPRPQSRFSRWEQTDGSGCDADLLNGKWTAASQIRQRNRRHHGSASGEGLI